MKLQSYSTYSRNALTLIEVIASLLIVSVMILGGVRALHLHLEQAKVSRSKSNAVQAAEILLQNWSNESSFNVPLAGSGVVAFGSDDNEPDQFQWRTRVVAKSAAAPTLRTVRLELFQQVQSNEALAQEDGSTAQPSLTSPPLVAVDVVVHTDNQDLSR